MKPQLKAVLLVWRDAAYDAALSRSAPLCSMPSRMPRVSVAPPTSLVVVMIAQSGLRRCMALSSSSAVLSSSECPDLESSSSSPRSRLSSSNGRVRRSGSMMIGLSDPLLEHVLDIEGGRTLRVVYNSLGNLTCAAIQLVLSAPAPG